MKKLFIILSLVFLVLSLYAFISVQDDTEQVMGSDPIVQAPESVEHEIKEEETLKETEEEALDFSYAIGPRFFATITKQELEKAVFVHDILPERANWRSHPIQDLEITLLKGFFEPTESGKSMVLNEAQMRLLRSADYSDNLKVFAHCEGHHEEMGDTEDYDLSYFISVLPEHQAEYREGPEAFLSYLKENSESVVAEVSRKNLQAGNIQFTVSTSGQITRVDLESSSGYPEVDDRMLDLIQNAPGTWEPASNALGLKVEQKLTFFFGMMGC